MRSSEAEKIQITYTGCAGFVLDDGLQRIAIDPLFSVLSYPGHLHLPFESDYEVPAFFKGLGAILATHAHADHVIDIPAIVEEKPIPIYGSKNVVDVMRLNKVSELMLKQINPGDHMDYGRMECDVLEGVHPKFGWVSIYKGEIGPDISAPLKVSQYKMDIVYSFYFKIGSTSLLFWNDEKHPPQKETDVLFLRTYCNTQYYKKIINSACPRVIIPYHWDLSFLKLPKWAQMISDILKNFIPVLMSQDLKYFEKKLRAAGYEGKIFNPEKGVSYEVSEILS